MFCKRQTRKRMAEVNEILNRKEYFDKRYKRTAIIIYKSIGCPNVYLDYRFEVTEEAYWFR